MTDVVVQLMEIRAKLDRGEELTDDERETVRATADLVVAALAPVREAITEMVVRLDQTFRDCGVYDALDQMRTMDALRAAVARASIGGDG